MEIKTTREIINEWKGVNDNHIQNDKWVRVDDVINHLSWLKSRKAFKDYNRELIESLIDELRGVK